MGFRKERDLERTSLTFSDHSLDAPSVSDLYRISPPPTFGKSGLGKIERQG